MVDWTLFPLKILPSWFETEKKINKILTNSPINYLIECKIHIINLYSCKIVLFNSLFFRNFPIIDWFFDYLKIVWEKQNFSWNYFRALNMNKLRSLDLSDSWIEPKSNIYKILPFLFDYLINLCSSKTPLPGYFVCICKETNIFF